MGATISHALAPCDRAWFSADTMVFQSLIREIAQVPVSVRSDRFATDGLANQPRSSDLRLLRHFESGSSGRWKVKTSRLRKSGSRLLVNCVTTPVDS
jgi:hypothetical protein